MGGVGLLGFHDGKEEGGVVHKCIHLQKGEVLLGGVAKLETALVLWVYTYVHTLNEGTLFVMVCVNI